MFLLCTSDLAAICLQERFTHAEAGDFIVSAQEGNYSLLFIRSLTLDTLLLEEISVPSATINIKNFNWKKWTSEKAPGHTSWTLYEIERSSGKLIECFSHSKNGWLYLDESEQFLTRLLTLPLNPVPAAERKKIGPAPASGESDTRILWNPPLVIDGKQVPKPLFQVLKAKWPEDGSRLSLCTVELYFSKNEPTFPFPYWLEVQSPHYTFKMRTIDSGHGLVSPIAGAMPHRSPQILGSAHKGQESWKLSIQTPPYFQKINLFIIDIFSGAKTTIPIPFNSKKGPKAEEMILEIATTDLMRYLKPGHKYRWVLIPEESSDIYVESEPFSA